MRSAKKSDIQTVPGNRELGHELPECGASRQPTTPTVVAHDLKEPCNECPWRLENHGRRQADGRYTRRNLKRLWNKIRRGGGQQSCHPTDPRDPRHQRNAGNPIQECFGSAIMVSREITFAASLDPKAPNLGPEGINAYVKASKERHGLTREGLMYHTMRLLLTGSLVA